MSFGTEEPIFTEESDDLLSVKSDDQSSVKSDDSSGSNRVKILYSYSGRILPRPGDGKLRYVGGETRVVAINRTISYADLMSKLAEIMGCSVVLKCQLPTEDLDALVSIKSDEDLENMLEEYDRLGAKEGSSKVRAFLFPKPSGPPKPVVRAVGGHIEPEPDRPIVLSLDEGPNGYVAGSIPSELYRQPQYVREMPCKPGRPPRCPPAHPDTQYNSPVRYAIRSATQIHDKINMPRQQKPAAYVAAGQYLIYNGNYQYIIPSPPATQVRIPGKAPRVPEEYSRKQFPYILHNPYHGGGLTGFRPQEQFLVQH